MVFWGNGIKFSRAEFYKLSNLEEPCEYANYSFGIGSASLAQAIKVWFSNIKSWNSAEFRKYSC